MNQAKSTKSKLAVISCLLWLMSFEAICQKDCYIPDLDSIKEVVNNNIIENQKIARSALLNVIPKLVECNDTLMLPKAYLVLGHLSETQGEHKEAIKYNQKYLSFAKTRNKPDEHLVFVCYSNISNSMKNIGYYDSAFQYLNRALDLSKRLSVSPQNNLHNLAILYQVTGNNTKALEYFRQGATIGLDSLQFFKNLSNPDKFRIDATVISTVSSLTAVSNVAITLGDSSIAKWAFREIEKVTKQNELVPTTELDILKAQFNAELAYRNFGRAHEIINRMLAKSKTVDAKFYLTRALIGVAQLSINSQGIEIDYDEASKIMQEGSSISMSTTDKLEYLFMQSYLFLKSKQIDSAIHYNDKYESYKALEAVSINQLQHNIEAKRKIAELENTYGEDYNLIIHSRTNNYNVYLYIATVLLLIGAILFGIHYARKRAKSSTSRETMLGGN